MEVGKQLSDARQRHGLTLDDISQTTKIPVSLLQAIERDDVARLPQGFFTRAFVRAYAKEVGVDAEALLNTAQLGEIEEVAVDEPMVNGPIDEPSSSKSVFLAFALGVACTMFYSGLASRAPEPEPVASAVAVAGVTDRAEPVSFAPPCSPAPPADTSVLSVRRRPVALPPEKIVSPVQPTPVTHVVPGTQGETTTAGVDSPAVSDAILPTPDVAPAPAPAEQF